VTDDAATRKVELRAAVTARRGRLSALDVARAGSAVAAHGLAAWGDVPTVAAYLSFGTEPPTRQLVDGLANAGCRVLLPIIDGDAMDWAAYAGPAELAPGPLGISQPTGSRLGTAALRQADLVVVPALAVDPAGHRLGRGRGFYDRALATVAAPVIAIVYDEELVDNVPNEPHDRRVDGVLRPAGVS
jgi:5-formyltetrahydrofolate cyclo-ligase